MVEINTNSTLPGVGTTVESASAVGVNVSSPADVGIVGQADLTNGTATENTAYEVRTPVKARTLFGSGSMLAEAIVDALQNGAFPVYAVAPEEISVTDEDHGDIAGTSGTLDTGDSQNAGANPIIEDASAITFTLDSSDLTTIITYDEPASKTPDAGEVYVNPVTAEFEIPSSPSTDLTVDYVYYDYPSATQAMVDAYEETVDFFGILTENPEAITDLESKVNGMEQRYNFALGVAGAAPRIADTASYTNPLDNSRMHLLYPSRNADDESIVGAYLGMRARIGLTTSGINKRLTGITNLAHTLSQPEQEQLIAQKVVPIADESPARVVDTPTCVTTEDSDEINMSTAFARLVVDYITDIVFQNSDRFIGKLHTPSARNNLEGIIASEMKSLLQSQAILAYSVIVDEIDSVTASVDVGVKVTAPLRNIQATITAGEVEA